jgi:hypothetical protein
LRRGRHPRASVDALRQLLDAPSQAQQAAPAQAQTAVRESLHADMRIPAVESSF